MFCDGGPHLPPGSRVLLTAPTPQRDQLRGRVSRAFTSGRPEWHSHDRSAHAFGNEQQPSALLSRDRQGTHACGGAITEPQSGSDVGSMKTRAVRDGGCYVLNCETCFTTLAPVADWHSHASAISRAACATSALSSWTPGRPGSPSARTSDSLG
ncbi:acyl-CoA dehydrogenase family protein [Bradyrhizobium sp. 5.13L]